MSETPSETAPEAVETKPTGEAPETAETRKPAPAKSRKDATGRALRLAIILVFGGLVLELVPLLYFRPITFLIFFFIGIPVAGLGMLIYVWRVLRGLQEKGAL